MGWVRGALDLLQKLDKGWLGWVGPSQKKLRVGWVGGALPLSKKICVNAIEQLEAEIAASRC